MSGLFLAASTQLERNLDSGANSDAGDSLRVAAICWPGRRTAASCLLPVVSMPLSRVQDPRVQKGRHRIRTPNPKTDTAPTATRGFHFFPFHTHLDRFYYVAIVFKRPRSDAPLLFSNHNRPFFSSLSAQTCEAKASEAMCR